MQPLPQLVQSACHDWCWACAGQTCEHEQEVPTALCVMRLQAPLIQHCFTMHLHWLGCYKELYLARLVVVAGLYRPLAPCMPVSLADLRIRMAYNTK